MPVIRFKTNSFILLGLICLLLYAHTFSADFFFDDHAEIVKNTTIRHPSNLPIIWDKFKSRFLAYESFSLNYLWGQNDPFGYHVVNTIIHFLNTCGIFVLALLIFQTPQVRGRFKPAEVQWIALFAGLIFLCHPLQTQAVTYIVKRTTSMATLFYLWTIIFYLIHRIRGRQVFYISALVANICAMFTKEISFTLPFMLLLFELLLFNFKRFSWHRTFGWLLPFFLSLAIIPLSLLSNVGKPNDIASLTKEIGNISRYQYFLTELNVICTYVRLVFIPVHQNVDYDFPLTMHLLEGKTILALLFLMTLFFSAIIKWRKHRLYSLVILWFFLTLSVESSFIPIRTVIDEHRMYLPMIGLSFGIALLLKKLIKSTKVYLSVVVICILVLSVLTFQRNVLWMDPIALWGDTVKKSPNKTRPNHNLGSAFISVKDYANAKKYSYKALDLDPNHSSTYVNLGFIAMKEGVLSQAKTYFDKAIEVNQYNELALMNAGVVRLVLHQTAEGESYLLKSLRIDPYLLDSKVTLAIMYDIQGKTELAFQFLDEVFAINPYENRALFMLIKISLQQGDKSTALKAGKTLLEKGIDSLSLTSAAGQLAQNQMVYIAEALYLRALAIDPQNHSVYLELGKLYGNLGKWDHASAVWEQGQNLFPAHRDTFLDLIDQLNQLKK